MEMWQAEQAQRCPSCGRYDWEQEESPEAWEAGLHLCMFCKSVEDLRNQVAEERHGLSSEGFKIRLYRNSDHSEDEEALRL